MGVKLVVCVTYNKKNNLSDNMWLKMCFMVTEEVELTSSDLGSVTGTHL